VDHRRPDEADAERLSDSAAKRLLTRATSSDPACSAPRISAAPGSRTLNVFATPEQLQKVRSVLDKQDVAGSAACAVAPLRAPPR
jgi:hypothetical protein